MTDLPERVRLEIEQRSKNWGAPTVARRHMEEVARIAMECAPAPEALPSIQRWNASEDGLEPDEYGAWVKWEDVLPYMNSGGEKP